MSYNARYFPVRHLPTIWTKISSFSGNALCNESVQQGTSSLNNKFCSNIYEPDHETYV